MNKLLLFFLLAMAFCQPLIGAHLKGGWIQYSYLGPGIAANTSRYQVTVRQYISCSSNASQKDKEVFLGIFDGETNALIRTETISLTGTDNPNKIDFNPCINPRPPVGSVCYLIDYFTTTITLPDNPAGYTLASQRCCKIVNITNLTSPSDDFGITYAAKIPGTINGVTYYNNSSPAFAQKDTVLICFNTFFSFDFSAVDADGDSLSYMFCSGATGGFNDRGVSSQQAARPNPPSSPPYTDIGYANGYSGSSPLGTSVIIDSRTGLISGIAPAAGEYVISVCANEYRNGVLISTTKKEIHVQVRSCTIAGAILDPNYITCNGTTLSFENRSTSSNITSYAWDFGIPDIATDISADPTPTYDYLQSGKDSGIYTVKLKVTSNSGCQDSTTAEVKVYPGFQPDFTVQSTCVINPYQFKDATTTRYGVVDSWRWDFGDTGSTADTARSKDSAWVYSSPQTVDVQLISTNSKGCIDTITKSVTILDKPQLSLPFRDTLICSIDTLALHVNISNGTAEWTPQAGPNQSRITNANSVSPLVYPTDTTTYYISINDNGCTNTDSVTVNVLQFVNVDVRDTAVCLTDTFRLQPVSHALSYIWSSPSLGENLQNIKFPLVQPMANTKYIVTANLGKCEAKDSLNVVVNPYPVATIGPDAIICFGSRIQLRGTITGSTFQWSPTASLINENTLRPTAGPMRTTTYILTANNATGCLKPKSDTTIVTVIPPLTAYAGRDTIIAAGQPLQLEASGGTSYIWTPATGLSNPDISNPIATLGTDIDSITYTVRATEAACYAEDQVTVRVFKTGADILVPSAFTPNGDGRNDALKPFTVGITKLTYFSIYNRWGQLVFTTNQNGKTWDGTFGGITQPAGTYVYQTLGVDYAGNSIFRKGTIVLIR